MHGHITVFVEYRFHKNTDENSLLQTGIGTLLIISLQCSLLKQFVMLHSNGE